MFSRLPWLLAPLALAACASPAPRADADPALWVVRDADTTVYLFGSVHTLRPGLSWFDEGVKRAFDRSDAVMLELVTPGEDEIDAALRDLGTRRAGGTLPPALAAKLRDALVRQGMDPYALDDVQPWLAAIQLASMPKRASGYESRHGVEAVLTDAAKRAGKPVSGLETLREQFGAFDRLSPAAQQALLEATIDALPRADATLEAIVAAWAKGDTDTLARLMNAELARSPELAQALLVARNRRWAEALAARMARPGTVFVAIGAGHLAGRDGLQLMLARRGFRVARIHY